MLDTSGDGDIWKKGQRQETLGHIHLGTVICCVLGLR